MIYRGLGFLVDIRGGTAKRICLPAVWSSLFHHVCVSSRYSSCQLFFPYSQYVRLFQVWAAASCLILSIFTICAALPCKSIAAGADVQKPRRIHNVCSSSKLFQVQYSSCQLSDTLHIHHVCAALPCTSIAAGADVQKPRRILNVCSSSKLFQVQYIAAASCLVRPLYFHHECSL